MNFRRAIILLLLMLFIASCSQNGRLYHRANKAYQKGLYDTAVVNAVSSLRLKPDNAKAQELLVKAWDDCLKAREDKISRLEQSPDANKWDQVYKEYASLEELGRQVKSLPVLVNPHSGYQVLINIPDYGAKLSSSRDNAAETHYQAGIRYAKISNELEIQKKAALEFKAALSLIPGYKDAELRYDQARKLAVKRLAIQPFEDKSSTHNHYGAISDLLTDQVLSQIMTATAGNEFLEIIARNQMDAVLAEQQLGASGMINEASTVRLGQLLGAHEILTGRILQINEAQERTVSINQEASAKVVIKKEKYTDEQGNEQEREVWGEVTCTYRKFTKTAGVSVSGSFSIIDVETGKIMLQESLESRFPWSESWCRKIAGDDRALNQNLKNLINKAEPFPPNNSEMVATALRDLGNNIVNKAKTYLNR